MKEGQGEGYPMKKWVLEESSASCGQDEQCAEDVREVPAGHEQDKHGAEDVREVPASSRQDKQGAEDVREVLAGYGQDKQGPGMQGKLQQIIGKAE